MRALIPAASLCLALPLVAQCPYYTNGTISAGLSRVGGGEDARLVYVDCIDSIGVVYAKFGSAAGASALNGLPLTIAVLDDPTDDHDPHDAVLVAQISVPGGVTGANTNQWQKFDLHALNNAVIPATGGMWIAVGVTYPSGTNPGPGSIEFNNNSAPGTQWHATDTGGNGLNYAALGTSSLVDIQTGPGFPPGTWVIRIESGAEHRPYDSGCAGSNGTPTLAGSTTLPPTPGQLVLLDITNLPSPSTATALLLSLAPANPIVDLGTFAGTGAIGCNLSVQPLSTVFLVSAMGTSSHAFALPSDPNFAGISVFSQVLALDPSANSLGVTSSNGLQTVIGF